MLESISKFKSAVLKSEYIKRLSHDLEIKEEALLQEIKRFATKARPQVHPSIQGEEKTFAIKPAEKLLIRLMLEENSLIDNIRGLLEPDDFQDEAASRIVSVMFDLSQQGRLVEPRTLIDHLAEEDVSRMICESVFLDDITVGDRQKLAGECIRRIKTEKMRSRRQDLHDQIKTAQHIGDEEKLRQLMQEFHELIKKG
jgi:replicative DNA helicase